MDPERPGRERASWPTAGGNAFRLPQEEEAEDPFANQVTPVFSRGGRSRNRPQRKRNNFSTPNPFYNLEPEDASDFQQYEDPFADARARNRAQYASNHQWPEPAAAASGASNSFAAHLWQPKPTAGANVFSAPASQGRDLFQSNTTAFASQQAFEIPTSHANASFGFQNANEASKPPKYPFKNLHTQSMAPFATSLENQGLAPRKQFTSFGNSSNSDDVDEWPDPEGEPQHSQTLKWDDAQEKQKTAFKTDERLSLFIRSVPISLFSTRAITEHFERLPVTVSNVSLRGSKQKEANRTAVVSFESEQEALLAMSRGRVYNGMILNTDFYEPYEVRKEARNKKRASRNDETKLPKLILTQLPRGMGSRRQIKLVLDGIADGVNDVRITQRPGPDGMERVAIITMHEKEAAEMLLKSQPRYNDRQLNISYLEDIQIDEDTMRRKNEKSKIEGWRASQKESKLMTEEDRLREMEQLRREIAKIEEKKRQQEARRDKRIPHKQRRMGTQERNEKSQTFDQQSKVEARLSKYGPQHSSSAPKKTYEQTQNEQWRKVGQKMDIQDAKQFVGVCQEMCPLTEFEARVEQRDVSIFELQSGPGSKPDPTKAVKKYRRSAAISEEQKPEEVRPPSVLARTMDHLKHICDSKLADFNEVHNFVRDRTRSIRQDFTLQGIRDDCCIKIHEESVRFHIMSEHRLFGTSPAKFSSKQNLEQLDKCLISLREMYDLRREKNLHTSPNEPEMQAYYILTQMSDPQTCVQLWTGFAQDVRRSAPVRFVLEVVKAVGGQFRNPVRFFHCVRRAPYLMACLMHSRFTEMRVQALRLLNVAYGSSNSRDEIPITTLTKSLCFEDELETQKFCELVGFDLFSVVREENAQQVIAPPCRDFDTSRVSLSRKIRSDKVIESKARRLAPSEIINGATADTPPGSGGEFKENEITAQTRDRAPEKLQFVPRYSLHRRESKVALDQRNDDSKAPTSNIEPDTPGEPSFGNVPSDRKPSAWKEVPHEKEAKLLPSPFSSEVEGSSTMQNWGKDTQARSIMKSEMPPAPLSSVNETPATPFAEFHVSTEARSTTFRKSFWNTRKLGSVQLEQDTHSPSGTPFFEHKADEFPSDVMNIPNPDTIRGPHGVPPVANRISPEVGEHMGTGEQEDNSEPLIAGKRGRQASFLAPKQLRTRLDPTTLKSEKDVSKGEKVGSDLKNNDQERLRERASKVVEERQRVIAIAKKARENRYNHRCHKVLHEFSKYAERVERSIEKATTVLHSLNTEEMSRSECLNACHSGFEHLERSLSMIRGVEDFLDMAKGWSWEGQQFPQLPVVTLAELREKGRVAWEKITECRRIALLRSPEASTDNGNIMQVDRDRKHVKDMQSELEMSVRKVTDRIPICYISADKSVRNPGLEVDAVFETLKSQNMLLWQAVVVGEEEGTSSADPITLAWIRSRLGKTLRENEMVINMRNQDILKYPCLSILQMDRKSELPVSTSSVIWSMDGSRGVSGLEEEHGIIENRLSGLHSQSGDVPKTPPFLILVCFDAKGAGSPGLRENLEQAFSSRARSLCAAGLICGAKFVSLSREIVLELDEDLQFTSAMEESVVSHQRLSVSLGADFQLQRLDDQFVEIGNSAWMDVLDRQLSHSYLSECKELFDVISNINRKWHKLAETVSYNANMWPTEFAQHRIHFIRTGAQLNQRMRLPLPTEGKGHNYAEYLRLLCSKAGVAFPRIQHDGFEGLAEFCRALGFILPRLVSSLLGDLKDVKVPLPRAVNGKEMRARVRRLNIFFTSVFSFEGNKYSKYAVNREKYDSNLGKRQRDDADGKMDGLNQTNLGSPSRRRRLSLGEEYKGGWETPKRRYSLPWKTFGSESWSERLDFMVAEAEAFGKEIDATIELLRKRRRVSQPEQLVVV